MTAKATRFGLLLAALTLGACSPTTTSRGPSSPGGGRVNGAGQHLDANGGGPSSASDSSGSDDGSISAPDATHEQRGMATWYGAAFAGKPTASGERFNPDAMTAAHRKLHFGTWVEVTRVDDGRSVRVRINDRGPFGDATRVIDLSRAAAKAIGMTRDGSAEVTIRLVDGP